MPSQIIATKKLTATESTFAIVFWMNVMQLAAGRSPAATRCSSASSDADQMPADRSAIGAAGLFAHYLPRPTRSAPATPASWSPLDFLRIPLIAVIGWWLYGEPLDAFVFAGAGLIIGGILWNLRAETPPLPMRWP